eukprot:2295848-Pyramimonas_sp.AAC.1
MTQKAVVAHTNRACALVGTDRGPLREAACTTYRVPLRLRFLSIACFAKVPFADREIAQWHLAATIKHKRCMTYLNARSPERV